MNKFLQFSTLSSAFTFKQSMCHGRNKYPNLLRVSSNTETNFSVFLEKKNKIYANLYRDYLKVEFESI